MAQLTPIKAIRAKCIDCSESLKDVRDCWYTDCPIYEYRLGHRPKEKAQRTPMKAIRAKCIDCCLGSKYEASLCPAEKCPLHAYRHGKKPQPNNSTYEEVVSVKRELANDFSPNQGIRKGDI